MLEVEGYKMFNGLMKITPKNDIPLFTLAGDWLYKPEYKCWYGQGRSFGEDICSVLFDETAVKHNNGEWTTDANRPDSIICSVCNCSESVWWADKGTKYCPNCGTRMKQ